MASSAKYLSKKFLESTFDTNKIVFAFTCKHDGRHTSLSKKHHKPAHDIYLSVNDVREFHNENY